MRVTYGKGFDVAPNAPVKVRFRETVLAAQQEMQQMIDSASSLDDLRALRAAA